MAKLYFKVGSDVEKVVQLRQEIIRLKQELLSMNNTPVATKQIETQIGKATSELKGLVREATRAGAVFENNFKSKIYDSSNSVNTLSSKIIEQKSIVRDVQHDVRKLAEEYRELSSTSLKRPAALREYKAARIALEEEKASLFGLQQEQAKARLSVKQLKDEYSLYKDESKEVIAVNNGLGISWKQALGILGGATVLKSFISNLVSVRGEMEMMEQSFEVLLKSKSKSDRMVQDIREYALISPLTVGNISQATQTLLGFNVEAEKVMPVIKQIGDIAMGDSNRFSSLTLAFSQMSATGRLLGQDLNQMINAGFNPLQVISEQTGKSIAELKKEMEAGAISSSMVAKAFEDATSKGGKFYGMLENSAGSIKNLQNQMVGAFEEAYNKMGQSSEGLIKGVYKSGIVLAENYKKIGKVLVSLITTFGAYKTAVALVTLEKKQLSIWTLLAEKRINFLNKALLTNPYVAVAVAVGVLVSTLIALSSSMGVAEKAQKRFNDSLKEEKRLIDERKQKIDSLISTIQEESSSTLDRVESMNQLKKAYPSIIQKYIDEKGHLKDIIGLKREIAEIESENLVKSNKDKLLEAEKAFAKAEKENKSGGVKDRFTIDWEARVYEETKATLEEARKLVQQDEFNAWQISLKSLTDKEIDTLIQENKRLYKSTIDENKKEAIKSKLEVLEAEKGLKVPDTIYADELKQVKQVWERAKAKLQEIEKDKSKFTTKQYEEAKKAFKSAENKYKDLGGEIALKPTEKNVDNSDKLTDLSFQVRQEEINLIKDSQQKKRQQIELDYNKEIELVKRKEKELKGSSQVLEALKEIALQKRDTSLARITQDELEAESKAWNEYLLKYGSYQEKREALSEKYSSQILKATTKGQKETLQKELDKELSTLNFDEFKASIDFGKVFGNLDNLSTEGLNSLRVTLGRYIKEASKSLAPTDVKELSEAFTKIDFKIAERDPFKELKTSLDEYSKATKEVIKARKELDAVLKGENKSLSLKQAEDNLAKTLNKRAEAQARANTSLHAGVSKAKEYLEVAKAITGTLEDFGVSIPDDLSDTLSGLDKTLSSLESIDITKPMTVITGVIGVIGGLGKTIKGFFGGKANKQHKEALQLLEQQRRKVEDIYQLEKLRSELSFKKGETVFGSDNWAKARNSADVYALSVNKLHKSFKELDKISLVNGSRKSGWGPWKKRKDVYQNILEIYPKLLSKEGELDKSLAQTVLSTHNMSDANKTALQAMIDNATLVEEAYASMQSYLEGVFGSLGSTLTDVFAESFQNGTNEVEKMFLSAGSMLEHFVKDFIESVTLGNLLQDASNQMMSIQKNLNLTDKQKLDSMTDVVGSLVDDAVKQQNLASELLEHAQSKAKEKGISIFEGKTKESQATRKGHQGTSEELSNEINGRLTALQEAGEIIRFENVQQSKSLDDMINLTDGMYIASKETKNIADEIRTIQINSYMELQDIKENTGKIIQPIKQMAKDMEEVKRNTSRL